MPERTFPVMVGHYGDRKKLATDLACPTRVPWAFMEQFEATVRSNHDQSLERLAQRGGLDPCEIMAAVNGSGLRGVVGADEATAIVALKKAVREWELTSIAHALQLIRERADYIRSHAHETDLVKCAVIIQHIVEALHGDEGALAVLHRLGIEMEVPDGS